MYRLCAGILFLVSSAVSFAATPGNVTSKTSKPASSVKANQGPVLVERALLFSKVEEKINESEQLNNQKMIRVQLAGELKKAEIIPSGKVYIHTLDDDKTYRVNNLNPLRITMNGNGEMNIAGIKTGGTIVIEPKKGTHLKFRKHTYSGKIYVIPKENSFMLVEQIDLETYLLGVVGKEMSPSWPVEALKAQAVAARTFAYMKMQKNRKDYDIRNTPSDQAYIGTEGGAYKNIQDAVSGTAGEVLTHNRKPFEAYYCANCGGHTEDGHVLTGPHAPDMKPFCGVVCETCGDTHNVCWHADVSAKALSNFVQKYGHLSGQVTDVRVNETASYEDEHEGQVKRVVSLKFITDAGSAVLACTDFQSFVGSTKLKACKIDTITKNSDGSFSFSGCGFGHGVGMCQDGARGMAKKGATYKEILLHYYPGSELEKI